MEVFFIETRTNYLIEGKMKATEIRLADILFKHMLKELNIRNTVQLKTWMKWYLNGECYRLKLLVGKQDIGATIHLDFSYYLALKVKASLVFLFDN